MKQYIDLVNKIINKGVWVENKRTGKKCKTIINHQIQIDVGNNEFPLLTTRKVNYKAAIGEIIGYIRGYTKTEDFHKLGVHTWDANAQNPDWLNHPNHKRITSKVGDLGLIYGAVGNKIINYNDILPVTKNNEIIQLPVLSFESDDTDNNLVLAKDIFKDIVDNLKAGNDNRGLIWSFWNQAYFELGCLRPCMYQHHFSLLGDTLYLTSTARSQDVLLGTVFNLVQAYTLLYIMAKLTGHKPGVVTINMVNCHIYEDQYEVLMETKQHERLPYPSPKLHCNKEITYEYLMDGLHPDDFTVSDYLHHPTIKYPFSV